MDKDAHEVWKEGEGVGNKEAQESRKKQKMSSVSMEIAGRVGGSLIGRENQDGIITMVFFFWTGSEEHQRPNQDEN